MTPAADNIKIRDAGEDDLSALLALNEAVVPNVNSLDTEQFHDLCGQAAYFRVAVADGGRVPAAFLVGLTEQATYSSPNFLWFRTNYSRFAYVDRIAVAEAFRRRGLASALYDDFEAAFRAVRPMLACEVNLRPPNPASMDFHRRKGFTLAGSQVIDDGKKKVAMLVKILRD